MRSGMSMCWSVKTDGCIPVSAQTLLAAFGSMSVARVPGLPEPTRLWPCSAAAFACHAAMPCDVNMRSSSYQRLQSGKLLRSGLRRRQLRRQYLFQIANNRRSGLLHDIRRDFALPVIAIFHH